MPVTPIPAIDRTSATFKNDVDTLFLTRLPQFTVELNQVRIDLDTVGIKQDAAAASATAAAAAAEAAAYTANVTKWVSGTNYAEGQCTWSPADPERRTYRRKTAGGGTTDPYNDTVNWAVQTGGPMTLVASATVSSPVINIDFLSVFSAIYDKYVIELSEILPTLVDSPCIRFAVGGTIINGGKHVDIMTVGTGSTNENNFMRLCHSGISLSTTTVSPSITVEVTNVNSTTGPKGVNARGAIARSDGSWNVTLGNGHVNSLPALSGFRLHMASTASFAKCTVRVYGIRN